jgi:ABC-type polysaccharide/polyol phosphate export permease
MLTNLFSYPKFQANVDFIVQVTKGNIQKSRLRLTFAPEVNSAINVIVFFAISIVADPFKNTLHSLAYVSLGYFLFVSFNNAFSWGGSILRKMRVNGFPAKALTVLLIARIFEFLTNNWFFIFTVIVVNFLAGFGVQVLANLFLGVVPSMVLGALVALSMIRITRYASLLGSLVSRTCLFICPIFWVPDNSHTHLIISYFPLSVIMNTARDSALSAELIAVTCVSIILIFTLGACSTYIFKSHRAI